jgi:hypothetical protein
MVIQQVYNAITIERLNKEHVKLQFDIFNYSRKLPNAFGNDVD